MSEKKQTALIIFGGAGTAMEIKETIDMFYKDQYDKVEIVWHEKAWQEKPKNQKILNEYDSSYIIGVSDFIIRSQCHRDASALGLNAVNVIHPTAAIAESAKLGVGNYIAANVSISSNAVLEDHIVVNLNVSLGHDSYTASNCIINPGARLSGNASLGEGVLLGSNAFVFQGVSIGELTKIDALTYVKEDVEDRMIVSVRGNRKFKQARR